MSAKISGGQILLDSPPTSEKHAVRLNEAGTVRAFVKLLNLNTTAPADLTTISVTSTKWIPRRLVACLSTANLSAATLGLYTAAAAGGTALAAPQALSDLTASGKFHVLTLAALTSHQTAQILYPRLTVAAGVAGTVTLFLEYEDLSNL